MTDLATSPNTDVEIDSDLLEEVQRLAVRGAHRGLSVADLVVAATAMRMKLIVLHEDADFRDGRAVHAGVEAAPGQCGAGMMGCETRNFDVSDEVMAAVDA